MADWLSAREVMERLRLKPQTLYAYVSRGRITAKPDSRDPRRSVYRAADVVRLEGRKARGRRDAAIAADTIAWGEPILESSITTIAEGRLWYRGQDAAGLAETARLEDVARLLWACGAARFPVQRNRIEPGPLVHRMFAALAARAASDEVMGGRSKTVLYLEAAAVLDLLVDAVSGQSGEGPIHRRLATAWNKDEAAGDLIRRSLVLLADHELNASTFAVRVTASTRASLAACVLSGLAALSGPLHGGMSARVRALLQEARGGRVETAVKARLDMGYEVPGFGHPLYPEGDPRARALLRAFEPRAAYRSLGEAAERITGHCPNLDFALTALCDRLGLPEDSPFALFAVARCTGWIAHALEQAEGGRLIRPRARYAGVPLGQGERPERPKTTDLAP